MPSAARNYAINENAEKQRFEADLGDGSFGLVQYKLFPGKIAFVHTEVPPAHEGQGVGSALVRFALNFARDRGLKVVPICPFFAAFIKNHPDVQDLLAPAERQKLGLG